MDLLVGGTRSAAGVILGPTSFCSVSASPSISYENFAEGDSSTTSAALEKLSQIAISRIGLKIRIPARQLGPQLLAIEKEVSKSISNLKSRKRIIGEPATLDRSSSLPKRKRSAIRGLSWSFEGSDGDATIVAVVSQDEVIEVKGSDDEGGSEPDTSRLEELEYC